MLKLLRTKRSLRDRINMLRNNIDAGRILRPADVSRFVFLCGANKSESEISERRKALLEFASANLPHSQFFLAERVFSLLQQEGHKENILDIEHKISEFADVILIVLESESSFTELGAFSHKTLRDKLIVINDKRFENTPSFVNLGPIKAIEEVNGKKHVITYKMNKNGISNKDAIGDVFSPLYDLLKEPLATRQVPLKNTSINPSAAFDKYSVMFVHDLLYISGPSYHSELIEILKQLFGNYDFKLKEHLGILSSFGAINRDKNGVYRSNQTSCFYEYNFDINKIISCFRNITMKYFPERIYGT